MTISVTIIGSDGNSQQFEARTGLSLMEVAVQNMVEGIEADCGGACACATCHVYVRPDWLPKLPAKSENESAMLAFAVDTRENSRLSCQIALSEALDGLTVTLPASQH